MRALRLSLATFSHFLLTPSTLVSAAQSSSNRYKTRQTIVLQRQKQEHSSTRKTILLRREKLGDAAPTQSRDFSEVEDPVKWYRRKIATRQTHGEDDPALHYNLAVMLGTVGDFDGAIFSYARTVALLPDHAHAHFKLGNLLWKKGELEGAISSVRRAIGGDECESARVLH